MKLFILFFALLLCLNVKGQKFTVIDTLPDGAYGNAAWGDFDGDGFKDLAYLTQAIPTTICKIYHNVGNVFTEIKQQLPYLYNPGAKWADLNNDGFDDLVVNGMDSVFKNRTFIYKSLGNGTFTSMTNNVFPLSAGHIDIADYNKDGLKDIAITGYDSVSINQAYIYKNLGGFQFARISAELEGVHFGELKWGDYNNDGLPDLIINGIGNFDFSANIYKNMGADSFQRLALYIKASAGTVDWTDLDNDGWLDILVTGYDSTSGHNFTELHHNNKNGTFLTMATNLPDFGEPSGVEIADFNKDGKKDICFIGGSSAYMESNSAMAHGNSTNVYDVKAFYKGAVINPIIASADMDNDGDIDLLFGNLILRNDGSGTGLDEHSIVDADITIYPNPAGDKISVLSRSGFSSATIYDLSGAEMLSIVNPVSHEIILDSLSEGVYFLKVNLSDGNYAFRKIVVARF